MSTRIDTDVVDYGAEQSAMDAYLADGARRAETLAMSVDGSMVDNVEYELGASPCGVAFRDGDVVMSDDVAANFPAADDQAGAQHELCEGRFWCP